MIAISKVQEELENVSKSVLNEVNDALDNIHTLDYSGLDISNRDKLLDIENGLREILRIMSQ